MIKADYRDYVITYSEALNTWAVDISGLRETFHSLSDAKIFIDELNASDESPLQAVISWRERNGR